jgi:hypothetical protein
VSDAYQTYRYPETLLIGRDGIVVERYIGPREWDSPLYEARLRRLLQGKDHRDQVLLKRWWIRSTRHLRLLFLLGFRRARLRGVRVDHWAEWGGRGALFQQPRA